MARPDLTRRDGAQAWVHYRRSESASLDGSSIHRGMTRPDETWLGVTGRGSGRDSFTEHSLSALCDESSIHQGWARPGAAGRGPAGRGSGMDSFTGHYGALCDESSIHQGRTWLGEARPDRTRPDAAWLRQAPAKTFRCGVAWFTPHRTHLLTH